MTLYQGYFWEASVERFFQNPDACLPFLGRYQDATHRNGSYATQLCFFLPTMLIHHGQPVVPGMIVSHFLLKPSLSKGKYIHYFVTPIVDDIHTFTSTFWVLFWAYRFFGFFATTFRSFRMPSWIFANVLPWAPTLATSKSWICSGCPLSLRCWGIRIIAGYRGRNAFV